MNNIVLSIIVPSYNTHKFLEKYPSIYCSEKLKGEIEILLVDDGSTDGVTPTALDKLSSSYQDYFKIIHKPNGGHGSTINEGLKVAKGKYFKVIDGDDEIDMANLEKMVSDLKNINSDIVVSDYEFVHDNTGNIEYVNCFKGGDKSNLNNYVLQIHSLTYSTDLWIKNTIQVREKAFYEDQEYVIFPIPFAKTINYLPYSCYKYHLGVEGQSVSLEGKRKHKQDMFAIADDLINYHTKYATTGEQQEAFRNIIAFSLSRMFENIIVLAYPNSPKKELKAFIKTIKEKDLMLY